MKDTIRKITAFVLVLSLVTTPIILGLNGSAIGSAKAESDIEWTWTHPNGTPIYAVEYVPEHDYVIVADDDYGIYVIDDDTQNIVDSWTAPEVTSYHIEWDSGRNQMYVANFDTVITYDINGNEQWRHTMSNGASNDITFNPNTGDVFAINYNDEVVSIDNTGSQNWVKSVSSRPYSVNYDSTNDDIYVGLSDSNMQSRNANDGSLNWETSGPTSTGTNAIPAIPTIDGYAYEVNRQYDYIRKQDSSGNEIWNVTKGDVSTTAGSYASTAEGGWFAVGGTNSIELRNEDGSLYKEYSTLGAAGLSVNEQESTIKLYAAGEDNTDSSTSELIKIDTQTSMTSSVSGEIKDEDTGNGIDSADVRIEDSNGDIVFDSTTNSTGYYETELTDGDYKLYANKEGYYEDSITFSVSGLDMNVDLSLSSKPQVSGAIISDNGEYVSNATVELWDNGTLQYDTITDSNGEFTITVDEGNYTLEVIKDGYFPHNQTVNVTSNIDLGDITIESKEYELNLRVSPYMNHSDTQEYVVRFNDDVVTENVTVTSSNSALIAVDSNTLTLNATDVVNDTGEVNITATYNVDNQVIQDSENVTVAPMEMDHMEILPPLYSTLTVATNETIQYLVLAVVAGAAIATITNSLGGIGVMIISLIMGWIMEYVPLGVLLASLFGGIFIMMNTRINHYRNR